MIDETVTKFSKPYLAVVFLLMLVLPLASITAEFCAQGCRVPMVDLYGKWFLFWGVGLRLFSAGLKQAINPAFTARDIFHLKDEGSFIVVRELGLANICLGVTGIISLFVPAWRMPAAFSGGLYFGIAGFGHIIKRPAGANEWVALVSDFFIFFIMTGYLIKTMAFNP